jgi:hypothetical protein
LLRPEDCRCGSHRTLSVTAEAVPFQSCFMRWVLKSSRHRRNQSSANVLQRIIDSLALRLALMLLKIRLQLLLGFGRIEQKFLTRAKSEPADVTVRQARRLADKSCYLQVALSHGSHDGKTLASGQMGCACSFSSGVKFPSLKLNDDPEATVRYAIDTSSIF